MFNWLNYQKYNLYHEVSFKCATTLPSLHIHQPVTGADRNKSGKRSRGKENFQDQPAPVVYATLMLWKKAGEKWSEDELVPVKNIKQSSKDKSITVAFRNGAKKVVRFE